MPASFLIWAQLVAPENLKDDRLRFLPWISGSSAGQGNPVSPSCLSWSCWAGTYRLTCQAVLRPPTNYLTVCLTWDDCILLGCGKLTSTFIYGLLEKSASKETECRRWSKPRFTPHVRP